MFCGRLLFKQTISTKRARDGIKMYPFCTSDGTTLIFRIHTRDKDLQKEKMCFERKDQNTKKRFTSDMLATNKQVMSITGLPSQKVLDGLFATWSLLLKKLVNYLRNWSPKSGKFGQDDVSSRKMLYRAMYFIYIVNFSVDEILILFCGRLLFKQTISTLMQVCSLVFLIYFISSICTFCFLQVKYLSLVGGSSVGDSVRRMMRKIGTNNMWSKFNMEGRHSKKAFKNTQIMRVITSMYIPYKLLFVLAKYTLKGHSVIVRHTEKNFKKCF